MSKFEEMPVTMEKWEITPFVRVGPLQFGMSRAAARALLGTNFKVFRKSRKSENDTDAYESLGVHLDYDQCNHLVEVDAFSPCPLYFKNVAILEEDSQTLLAKMQVLGHPWIATSSIYCFEGVGISVYVPYGKRIESAGACGKEEFASYLETIRASAEKERLRAERRKAGRGPRNPFRTEKP